MDDLVVDTYGGKYGGYDGGGITDIFWMPGRKLSEFGFSTVTLWSIIIVLIVLLIAMMLGYTISSVMGLTNPSTGIGYASTRSDGWGEPSETNLRLAGMDGYRDQDAFAAMRESFNSREPPYYPDVTNRVLRMEDREREAIRALGKINQERLRRAAEDANSAAPLAWDPFWTEWKQAHPLDGEGINNFSIPLAY